MQTDFTVFYEGGLNLLQPNSQAARDWCDENLPLDSEWIGGRVAVDNKWIGDLARDVSGDGLTICDSEDQDLDRVLH